MARAIALVVAGVALLMVALVADSGDQQRHPEVAAAERQVQLAQLEHREREIRESQRWITLTTAAVKVGATVLVLSPLLILALIVRFAWDRSGLVWPRRSDGALPWRLDQLEAVDARVALEARAARDLAAASRAPVPKNFTFSPHVTYKGDKIPSAVGAAEVPPPGDPLTWDQVPKRVDCVVLGQEVSAAREFVQRPWERMLSLAIGGTSGTGKTSTAVSIALQALQAGHQLAIIDPHAADEGSLVGRLAPARDLLWRPPAVTLAEALAMIEVIERLITERADGTDRDRRPVTLLIDEFTRIMRSDAAPRMANVLEGVVSEGRKLGVRAIMIGQRWSASRTGGSGDLRDVIPHVLMHRMRRGDARMLSGLATDELPDTTMLRPGECWLLEDDSVQLVRQPMLTTQDVASAVAQLPAGESSAGPRSVPAAASGDDQDPSGTNGGPTQDRVIALFRGGSSVAEITDLLAETRQRGSGKWKRTRAEVERALRDGLSR